MIAHVLIKHSLFISYGLLSTMLEYYCIKSEVKLRPNDRLAVITSLGL